MNSGKSLRQAGANKPGCWMVNTDCRYDVSESMAALVMASLASLRLADTERSTAGEGRTSPCQEKKQQHRALSAFTVFSRNVESYKLIIRNERMHWGLSLDSSWCSSYPYKPAAQWWPEHQLQRRCLTESWPQEGTWCAHGSSARLWDIVCVTEQINPTNDQFLIYKVQVDVLRLLLPLLEVYSSAAWKETTCMSSRFSSMDIWTANPASGLTLGRDSRSVERTKKFPWNVWMDKPGETHKTKQQQIKFSCKTSSSVNGF